MNFDESVIPIKAIWTKPRDLFFLSAIALRFDLFLPSSLQFQSVTHSTDAANNMGNISFFT